MWQTIANHHIYTRGWTGIGYHVGIGYDGTINQLGDLDSQRAHVQNRNHELMGIAVMGDFSHALPFPEQLEGLRQALAWLRSIYGDLPVLGHREAALPDDPTSCPGEALMAFIREARGEGR